MKADGLTLDQNEVHVWTVALDASGDADAPDAAQTLTATERAHAARLGSGEETARYVRRRAALRTILGGYLRAPPRDIVFSVNAHGKPSVLAPKTSAALAFNTSRSGAIGLVAVGRSLRIGVDVERIRSDVDAEAVARQFFAASEQAQLDALDPPERIAGFFNAWTRKEAVAKALGKGLAMPRESFEVSVRPGEPAAILRWNVPGGAPGRWRLHHLAPADGYVGALAVDSATAGCRCLQWQG